MQDPFTWLNPPAHWQRRGGDLIVTTDDRTDFWRKTEYGFIRDNGHFAHRMIVGNFSLEVTFAGKYRTLYPLPAPSQRGEP